MRSPRTIDDVVGWAAIPVTETGCWIWLGAVTSKGYGRIKRKSGDKLRKFMAHRVVYEMVNGPIPDGMCLCHRCDVPACVNPAHMFIGSKAENNLDRSRKGRDARGETSGMARLKDDWVRDIRKSRATIDFLAWVYEVNRSTVASARRGKTWRHVA